MRSVSTPLLSDEECDTLINAWDTDTEEVGEVFFGEEMETSDLRSGHLCWLEFADHKDIVDRVVSTILQANREYFNYDLKSFRDRFQLSRYREGDYYGWHQDVGLVGLSSYRRLSFSIQLSHSDDYEGGDLELPEDNFASRERGVITIFPSETHHRVTEVTKGVRFALVGWASCE